jgi:ATP-binding protein involved in chromosome partitioning
MTDLRNDVLAALDQVIDPASGRTVVQQDMIQGLVVKDGHVGFVLEVAPERASASEGLRKICEAMALGVKGVKSVTAVLTAHDDHPHHHDHDHKHDHNHGHSHAPKPAFPASLSSSRWPAAKAAWANPPSR